MIDFDNYWASVCQQNPDLLESHTLKLKVDSFRLSLQAAFEAGRDIEKTKARAQRLAASLAALFDAPPATSSAPAPSPSFSFASFVESLLADLPPTPGCDCEPCNAKRAAAAAAGVKVPVASSPSTPPSMTNHPLGCHCATCNIMRRFQATEKPPGPGFTDCNATGNKN